MWRAGRSVGRTLYDENDELIGVMDTSELAAIVVDAVNRPEAPNIAPEAMRVVRSMNEAILWMQQDSGELSARALRSLEDAQAATRRLEALVVAVSAAHD